MSDGGLPDLGGVTLAELRRLPDAQLAPAMRDVVRRVEEGNGARGRLPVRSA